MNGECRLAPQAHADSRVRCGGRVDTGTHAVSDRSAPRRDKHAHRLEHARAQQVVQVQCPDHGAVRVEHEQGVDLACLHDVECFRGEHVR